MIFLSMLRSRLSFFFASLLLPLGMLAVGLPATPGKKPLSRLNLLLVTIDTLRADRLGCYGGVADTPRIDQLAGGGVLFTLAFANTTTTLPSHTNILLGSTPSYHGVHENLNFKVNDEFLTLAELIRSNGYATAAFVAAYPLDARFGLSQGFDVYDDRYDRIHYVNPSSLERPAEQVVDGALDWLEGRENPWFLWVHFWDPHTPYAPPEPYKSRYPEDPYSGEITYVDSELGRLLDYLREKGLAESTAVFLTGDHGESLGEHGEKTHGYLAYNTTLRIPLIMAVPGRNPGRIDRAVSHIDIFPTACEVLDIKAPSELQGISLEPCLRGKDPRERPIYFESLYPYYSRGWAPIRGYIRKGKKFIDSPIPEVYDLNSDFNETKNLAGKEKLDSYRRALADIIREQTTDRNIDARQTVDKNIREKMASLGYMSSRGLDHDREFVPSDDVKTLLPLINRADEALDLHASGRTEDGIRVLLELIEERSDVDMAYKHLASIYQDASRPDDAAAILERGLKALPDNYEIFQDFIKLMIDTQRFDRVLETFAQSGLREEEFDPEAWNNLGIAYAKTGDLEKAVEAYRTGLAIDDRYPELYNNLANACYSQALETRDTPLFNQSLEYYKKAIEIDPDFPAPYFGLGHAYRQAGDIGAAVYCWEKTLEVDPDFRQAYIDLASAYAGMGSRDKALALSESYRSRYGAVMTQSEKNELEEFIRRLRK